MYLQKLSLTNFKNYPEAEFFFSGKINCFVGNNGVGKTNILDAVHYLSFCKSYFNVIDSQNIMHEKDFFSINGIFQKDENTTAQISCYQQHNHRKIFKINKKEYNRLADHIGLFPVVMVSPQDNILINGGSEERRRFIDGLISQFDKFYLDDLINYNKALFQRNRLLKLFAEKRYFDQEALELWNVQLIMPAMKIYDKRKAFIRDFIPIFNDSFSIISGGNESVFIDYISQLNEETPDVLLKNSMNDDRRALYTTKGIHKDDLIFNIGNHPIKKFGSQGQQKSFTVAIKLAQFEYTRQVKEFKPIMLFDDVFDKLDHDRVEKIIKMVSEHNFGQVFFTDTDKSRMLAMLKKFDNGNKIFEIFADASVSLINKDNHE